MEFDFGEIVSNLKKGSYKYLGTGSGRLVYDMGNGYVVKAAKNRKGVAQNRAEYAISQKDESRLFAKIPKVSESYDMVIMEKAEILGQFTEIFDYYKVKNYAELFRLPEFRKIIREYGLLEPDLRRIKNWGKIDDRPVIIDYGFTLRVRNNYYFPF